MQFWRSLLQAQQVGNMQSCSGWGNGMHPSRTAHLCWLEQGPCCCCSSQEAGTPHPAPALPQPGSMLHGTHFLPNSDYRSYLILHSPAQLRGHNSGIFLLLLLGCPWANATSCALEEWQKFKKICLASLALIIFIRFLYSSSPFSVFSDLTCS